MDQIYRLIQRKRGCFPYNCEGDQLIGDTPTTCFLSPKARLAEKLAAIYERYKGDFSVHNILGGVNCRGIQNAFKLRFVQPICEKHSRRENKEQLYCAVLSQGKNVN